MSVSPQSVEKAGESATFKETGTGERAVEEGRAMLLLDVV